MFNPSADTIADPPIWLVLAQTRPSGPTAVVVNVGGPAQQVTIRQVWDRGIGPTLAQTFRLEPEGELQVWLDPMPEDAREAGLSIEWRDGEQRHRHYAPLPSLP